jgi:hypothetical protein
MPTITIVDESTRGEQTTWNLDLLEETLSLRELIRRRIYQEVTEYNARQSGFFHGLVQPTDAERTLNGARLRTPHRLDWEAQYAQALTAFARRSYLVLVDDQQVADLDAVIELCPSTEVTFLKLIPLVGG